jgi:hypothetical protein
MKIYTLAIFRICLISFAFCSIGRAYGQEAGSPSFELYDMEPATVNERVLSTPGETIEPVKPTLNTSNIKKNDAKRDSSAVRLHLPSVVKPPVTPAKKQDEGDEDDSILSFNFLYYLIERYKMQDIVD